MRANPAPHRDRAPVPPPRPVPSRKGGKPGRAAQGRKSGLREVLIGLAAIAITAALILSYWFFLTPGPTPPTAPKQPAKTNVRSVK